MAKTKKQNSGSNTYASYAEQRAKKSNLWKDCVCAFLVGGLICTFGELLKTLYTQAGLDKESAGTLVSVTLVFLTAFFTGIGWFDSLARIGGAGTLVPITGFANSVVSPALDNKADESAIIYPSQTNLHNSWGEDDSVQNKKTKGDAETTAN